MRPLPTLALLLALAAAPVAAQTAPSGPPPRPTAAERQAHHAQQMQRETDDLALLLDLKPAQRPMLEAFLKDSRPHGGPMEGKPMPGAGAEPGFEQHLAAMEEHAAKRAAEGSQRLATLRRFYGALDPHQKQLFEALMRLRHGGMDGPHRGPGHAGPGGPGGPGGMPHDGPPPAQ